MYARHCEACRAWLMVALPAGFLLVFFVAPNAFLLTSSFLKSESQVLTNEFTLQNYAYLLGRPLYLRAILRSFWIGALVGLIVVRSYGWWVLLNREGPLSDLVAALLPESGGLTLLPSSGAIVVGLVHSLLPYGVLTILSALNGVNPNLERAAMSLGASRLRIFAQVTLPLSFSGVAGGFLLAFSLSISAYATPAILGGPATATMATQIYDFMTALDDWSLGSAMGAILIFSAMTLLVIGAAIGARRAVL